MAEAGKCKERAGSIASTTDEQPRGGVGRRTATVVQEAEGRNKSSNSGARSAKKWSAAGLASQAEAESEQAADDEPESVRSDGGAEDEAPEDDAADEPARSGT